MKSLTVRWFRGDVLAFVIGGLILGSHSQLFSQTSPASHSQDSYDGTYVPDRTRNSGAAELAKTPPCLATEAAAFGQGLTVAKSVGTFLVGVQPQGAPKIKPTKASGKVDATGSLAISQGMISLKGKFDGPANGELGHQNTFSAELTLRINRDTSCTYQLFLIHGPK